MKKIATILAALALATSISVAAASTAGAHTTARAGGGSCIACPAGIGWD